MSVMGRAYEMGRSLCRGGRIAVGARVPGRFKVRKQQKKRRK
jgi:hypothetical protein